MHSLAQPAEAPARDYVRLFLGLAFFLALFGVCCGAIASADTWWHLATGRWIVEHHAVPRTDPFSFTMSGKPWVAHEYLTDILMYASHRAGGMIVLAVENAFLLTAAFAIIAFTAKSDRWVAWLAALFAAFSARPAFALRPQSISLMLGALFLWILLSSLRTHQPVRLIALPCLMLLWVQLHAGYLLGLGLIGLVLAGELLDALCRRTASTPRQWLALACALVASVAVVSLNPNGFTMLTFPFYVMRMKINATILEWRAPNLHDPHLYPFIILAVLTLITMLLSRERYRPGRFLLFGVLLAAALTSARNIPIFCLVAALLLAEDFRALPITRRPEDFTPTFRTIAAAGLLVLAAIYCSRAAADGLAFQALAEKNLYPQKAVSFLADQHLPPNLFNDYTFGGYLIWRLYPEYKVFVDGRADLYGDDFLARYVEIYDGEADPSPLLDQYGINTVMLSPRAGMTTLLRLQAVQNRWKIAFEDDRAVVFVRSASGPAK